MSKGTKKILDEYFNRFGFVADEVSIRWLIHEVLQYSIKAQDSAITFMLDCINCASDLDSDLKAYFSGEANMLRVVRYYLADNEEAISKLDSLDLKVADDE